MGFVLFSFAVVALMVAIFVLLARIYPGSGADLLDWKPTRSYADEALLESQDLEQMIEAQNAYRRRRGDTELTPADARRMGMEDEAVREQARVASEKRALAIEDEPES